MKLGAFVLLLAVLTPFVGYSQSFASIDGQNKRPDPSLTASSGQKTTAPAANYTGESSHEQDAPNHVQLTELPPVSLTRDWIDLLALSFSGILVLIGIGGVWYAKKTLESIQAQLGEIKVAGEQTAKLISHAESQAAATTTVAEAAAKAAIAAHTSADAYQLAERAWMTFTDIVYSKFFNSTAGDSTERIDGTMFQIKWKNVGHTPAIKCSILAMRNTVNSKDSPIPTFVPRSDISQAFSPIAPGVSVGGESIAFLTSEIEALKKRECRIFLFGRADYQTVYRTTIPPHTEICLEVIYGGMDTKTGETRFQFRPGGLQNSAT